MKLFTSFPVLALMYAACTDADFATPAPTTIVQEYATSGNIPDESSLLSACEEVRTTQRLSGTLRIEPHTKPTEPEEILLPANERGQGVCYVIEATGDGYSESFTRCTSLLSLRYNTADKRLTGTLISNFFQGEVLEQHIEGTAGFDEEKGKIVLYGKLKSGSLDLRNKVLHLDAHSGTFTIVFPVGFIDDVNVNIETSGMFCIAINE